ncbi:MAG: TRAP transporter large permease subunit [Elusimicrobiota bacterium]|jgi:tripartite ATP-independent transporter DctM subunit|nr:TRAP transporter large permease subunit [Elusimicrobiota bacterium]
MGLVICLFLIFLLLGMPIAFAIGISGFAFFLINPEIPMTIVVQKALSTTQSFTMLAIPLFIFAGNLMNNTGITKRLIKLANVVTGHMYGNLAQVSCVLATLMGGVSGSATADAAMQARILGPDMVKKGYARGFAAAINAVAGLIVATIPPSMGLIIYGSVGEVSIGRLFAAGILPGILMMIFLMIAVTITSRKRGYKPENEKMSSLKDIFKALIEGIWALLFPILLILFIRFGIMTPSESGAFAVVYALVIGAVVYKELTVKSFIKSLIDSSRDIAVIMFIIALSGIFGYGVVYEQLPLQIANGLLGITSQPIFMLLMIVLLLVVCGMFMETTIIALILTPILLPVVKQIGVDPVHFGIIMMTVVTSGIVTPPVGVSLFAVSSILECPVEETARHEIPFLIAILAVVSICIFFPKFVLLVPDWVFGISTI